MMREDCKHFQSRTYSSGEAARFCVLDLAPEAPWRCPPDCKAYELRLVDMTFDHGGLVEPPLEDEPDVPREDVVTVLDEAEEIVNAITPQALEEVRAQQASSAARQEGGWLGRFRRKHR